MCIIMRASFKAGLGNVSTATSYDHFHLDATRAVGIRGQEAFRCNEHTAVRYSNNDQQSLQALLVRRMFRSTLDIDKKDIECREAFKS